MSPQNALPVAPMSLADVVRAGRKLRAVVLGSGDRRPEIEQQVEKLLPDIREVVDIVDIDFHYSKVFDSKPADIAIVFGGDGSILRAAHQLGYHQVPVVGVNLGRLGFLADIPPAEVLTALKQINQGEFRLIDHLMFRCQVFLNGEVVAEELGLNELAILGGPPFSIQHIDLYVDDILATTYLCDGLIISTPVGSTAYNLSAGGPILRKNLQAFVISPISPHTLTVRPIVDTADRIYEVIVTEPNESTSAVVDGQPLIRLTAQHRVRITKAAPVFQLIEAYGHNYYSTLREKLGWSGGIPRR